MENMQSEYRIEIRMGMRIRDSQLINKIPLGVSRLTFNQIQMYSIQIQGHSTKGIWMKTP